MNADTVPINSLYVVSGSRPGVDPERNLTRVQPKARGCGYMGVALI